MGLLDRIFARRKKRGSPVPAQVFFTNTLSGKKELFIPQKPGLVLMYTCGPTVYQQQHIGNLRPPLISDLVARVLRHAGYEVKRVLNITDVGHLVGDGDEGEDKIAVSARKEKKTPKEIAEHYTQLYLDDLENIGIDIDDIRFPRATDYIREQIALAKTLEEKGLAYRLPDGLYFDTSRFLGYGKLGNLSQAELIEGARVAKVEGKRNPADFALWRRAKKGDLQMWDSPWGLGNPGWHIECSAMSRALLGPEIDIHMGGEDLASIHHNDEIAQSESASGRPFVRYWLHNAFLNLEGEKISKSLGNVVYLSDVTARGYHPLALRYFYLQAHYRTPLTFSWGALAGAGAALARLWALSREVKEESRGVAESSEPLEEFRAALRDDLATPQALGVLWESLKSDEFTPEEKWGLLTEADKTLGLMLVESPETKEPEAPLPVRALLVRREAARAAGDYAAADQLREEIEKSGYRVEDGPEGTVLTRKPF